MYLPKSDVYNSLSQRKHSHLISVIPLGVTLSIFFFCKLINSLESIYLRFLFLPCLFFAELFEFLRWFGTLVSRQCLSVYTQVTGVESLLGTPELPPQRALSALLGRHISCISKINESSKITNGGPQGSVYIRLPDQIF